MSRHCWIYIGNVPPEQLGVSWDGLVGDGRVLGEGVALPIETVSPEAVLELVQESESRGVVHEVDLEPAKFAIIRIFKN